MAPSPFFCAKNPSALETFVDFINFGSCVGFIVVCFLDWGYWKVTPY